MVAANVDVTVVCPWHVLYVANGSTGVTALIIDPSTGASTQVPGASFLVGQQVEHVAADSSGQHLFVGVNSGEFADDGPVISAAIDPASAALSQISSI